jgi:hypothetical protein
MQEAMGKIFDKEGEEDAGHDNGCRCCFVCEGSQAIVCEHEVGVCEELYLQLAGSTWRHVHTYVHKCCRDDDARAELSNDNEHKVISIKAEEVGQNHWTEDSWSERSVCHILRVT